ncbi:MAG: tripartite tricarboxylate transporter substrate binding protein [Proteobacteria bacterium]|nr:tripartite tricarboxylate transporter substrate binding protein [Pseudomonadota bacterium]
MTKTFTRRIVMAGAALAMMAGASQAQNFPSAKPITLVVPFAAGGSTDIVARIIGQKMSELLGQNVIIENVAGAGGNVGTNRVAKATPDGYTILMGTISTHAINPAVFKKMPHDPVKDFAPISLLALVPSVLTVSNDFPAKDVKEMIARLKAEPDKHSYASSGVATPQHLGGELFKSMTGTQMQHIPYRGGGPALQDVVAGKVAMIFDNLPSSAEMIRAGKVRGFAITTTKRSPAFPDMPTMAEAGIPGYEIYSWNALFAPAGTPKDVVAKLNEAANKAVQDPAVSKKLSDLSAVPTTSTPDELGEHVKKELAKWGPIVKSTGASLD